VGAADIDFDLLDKSQFSGIEVRENASNPFLFFLSAFVPYPSKPSELSEVSEMAEF